MQLEIDVHSDHEDDGGLVTPRANDAPPSGSVKSPLAAEEQEKLDQMNQGIDERRKSIDKVRTLNSRDNHDATQRTNLVPLSLFHLFLLCTTLTVVG